MNTYVRRVQRNVPSSKDERENKLLHTLIILHRTSKWRNKTKNTYLSLLDKDNNNYWIETQIKVHQSLYCCFFFFFSVLYCPFLFVTGWEVSRPKEAIQANAARARRQTSAGRRGRPATLEPGQSSGRGAVGRLDFSSPTEGAAGWADVVQRTRQRRRGEFKISNLFYLKQPVGQTEGDSASTLGAKMHLADSGSIPTHTHTQCVYSSCEWRIHL